MSNYVRVDTATGKETVLKHNFAFEGLAGGACGAKELFAISSPDFKLHQFDLATGVESASAAVPLHTVNDSAAGNVEKAFAVHGLTSTRDGKSLFGFVLEGEYGWTDGAFSVNRSSGLLSPLAQLQVGAAYTSSALDEKTGRLFATLYLPYSQPEPQNTICTIDTTKSQAGRAPCQIMTTAGGANPRGGLYQMTVAADAAGEPTLFGWTQLGFPALHSLDPTTGLMAPVLDAAGAAVTLPGYLTEQSVVPLTATGATILASGFYKDEQQTGWLAEVTVASGAVALRNVSAPLAFVCNAPPAL
jgi:hypothetical protein